MTPTLRIAGCALIAGGAVVLRAPTLTLTTCHPRFSARERLVVFAELAA